MPNDHSTERSVWQPEAATEGWRVPANRSACAACLARGKNWEGSDPTCSFLTGSFSQDGWNCATANLIRDIVYEGQSPMPSGVDYQYCQDMKYATIRIDDLDIGGAMALWVAWYKSRGRTDALWLLFSDQPPRAPTAEECASIARSYELRNRE